MAHIIAFMDDIRLAGLSGQGIAASSTKVRRRPNHLPRLKGSLSDSRGLVLSAVSVDDVRMDRVNALRAAIADGSYKVSAADLADKILDSMLQK